MTNALRKIALPTTIAIVCTLILINARIATKNLNAIQAFAAQRTDAAEIQSAIAAVDLDLQHVESGQRGYLLTGDASYLAPYNAALQKLPQDFSALRARLNDRSAQERALETELRAVTESKIDDADETIRLRQKGYRHRAFLVVDSNRGKELMDKAQSLLASLLTIETRNVAEYQQQLAAGERTAMSQTWLASAILLAVTVLALLVFHLQSKRLEEVLKQQTAQLQATAGKLDRLTTAVSSDVRLTLTEMQTQAGYLLNSDAGFLPRQGQERAQWLYEATRYMNGVLIGLLEDRPSAEIVDIENVAVEAQAPELAPTETVNDLRRSQSA